MFFPYGTTKMNSKIQENASCIKNVDKHVESIAM